MIDRDHQQLLLVRQETAGRQASVRSRDQGDRVDGPDGPSVFEDPLLLQEDDGSATGLSGEPKKGSKADAVDGSGSLPASQHSKPAPGHLFPYLLKGVEVNRVDQVWRTSPTSPWRRVYLGHHLAQPATLAWKLSHHGHRFCVAALEEALGKGRPVIFNTDQGSSSPVRPPRRCRSRGSRSAWMVSV